MSSCNLILPYFMLIQPRKSCKEESAQSYPVSESPDEHTGMQGSCPLLSTDSYTNWSLISESSTCMPWHEDGFVSNVDGAGGLQRIWEVNTLTPET